MQEYIPYLQVRSNAIILYDRPTRPHKVKSDPLGLKTYTGKSTTGNIKRIKSAIDIFLQKTQKRKIFNPVIGRWHDFRLAFVTLTIPDDKVISGRDAHKILLKPFLRSMQKNGRMSYLWKAELQKRGQLHYHVTWNEFRDYSFIRNKWNSRLRVAGLSQEYAKVHGHFNPNSTDVHSVRHIRDFGAYLAKYMSKDPGGNIDGKIWDCSKDLKIKRFSSVMTYHNEVALQTAINNGHAKMIKCDHCVIVQMDKPLDVLTLSQQRDYIQWKS